MKPEGETEGLRTIGGLAAAYRSRSAHPVAVTRAFLQRIASFNPLLNCFITVLADSALKAAAESEKRIEAGAPRSLLEGVPVAVKDLIYIEGVRCTAGSRILGANMAAYDATVVSRLKAAGAVLVGTTNLHEFAAGVTNINPHYGPVRNPWDTQRMPGGSSGGSAAAVAGGLVAGALGTDTGGSTRIPAALCGIMGLKPTYGRVSRLGVIPLSSSLDTVGALASTSADICAILQVTAGHQAEDMTTATSEVPDFAAEMNQPLSSPRIGLVRGFFHESIDPEVEQNFEGFVSKLRGLGCRVDEASIAWVDEAYRNWLPVRKAEATAFHLRWLDTCPELYGEDVRTLLEEGRKVSAVEYVSAVNARPSFMEMFARTMEPFDLLAVPCTSVPAPKLRETSVDIGGRQVDVRTALIRLSIPFNYIGCPVLAVPSGTVRGLPVGVQLVGKLFEEGAILRLARAYEEKYGPFPHPVIPEESAATP